MHILRTLPVIKNSNSNSVNLKNYTKWPLLPTRCGNIIIESEKHYNPWHTAKTLGTDNNSDSLNSYYYYISVIVSDLLTQQLSPNHGLWEAKRFYIIITIIITTIIIIITAL